MAPVEVLVLVPLLVTMIFLNTVLIDSLMGGLDELRELGEKFKLVFADSSRLIYESLIP